MNLAFRAGCDLKCFPHSRVITSRPGWGSKTHINVNKCLIFFLKSKLQAYVHKNMR